MALELKWVESRAQELEVSSSLNALVEHDVDGIAQNDASLLLPAALPVPQKRGFH
jgi:hypothetical protein